MITMQFNDFTDLADKCTEASAAALAAKIVGQAKTLLDGHTITGRLKNSVMWKNGNESGGFNDSEGEAAEAEIEVSNEKFTAWVGTTVYYAPYEEYGTRYRAPHPFLRPSIMLYTGQAGAKEVKERIDKELAMGKLKPGQVRVFK